MNEIHLLVGAILLFMGFTSAPNAFAHPAGVDILRAIIVVAELVLGGWFLYSGLWPRRRPGRVENGQKGGPPPD